MVDGRSGCLLRLSDRSLAMSTRSNKRLKSGTGGALLEEEGSSQGAMASVELECDESTMSWVNSRTLEATKTPW